MTKNLMPKVLKYIGLALAILTALFLLNCNHVLAGMVTLFLPTAYPWVFAALLLIEAAAFYWLWQAWFTRPDHLAFDVTDSNARKQLESMLVERLYENISSTKDAELKKKTPNYPNMAVVEECVALLNKKTDPKFVEDCLALLNKKANEEIQSTARRIFVATALSQNGRIDTIIVFVGLCRMVWRISSIYNQKPHPSEVFRLYKAVATSTFLAFSIEELNIATEISTGFGELLKAAAPAVATRAVPIVGHTLEKVTASAIDGAANCFLALRTGIIARNTFNYILNVEERPKRVKVFQEAGAMLLDISRTPLKNLVGTAKDTLAETVQDVVDGVEKAIQSATSKAIDTIETAKEKAVQASTETAKAVADETKKATQALIKAGELAKDGAVKAIEATKDGSVKAIEAARNGSVQAVEAAKRGSLQAVEAAKDSLVKTGETVINSVVHTGETVISSTVKTGEAVIDAASKTGGAVKGGAKTGIAHLREFARNSTESVTQAGRSAVSSITNAATSTREAISRTIKNDKNNPADKEENKQVSGAIDKV